MCGLGCSFGPLEIPETHGFDRRFGKKGTKRLLELGAGTGVTGLVACKLGYGNVHRTPCKRVYFIMRMRHSVEAGIVFYSSIPVCLCLGLFYIYRRSLYHMNMKRHSTVQIPMC